MKAEINQDRQIVVTAETVIEAFALKYIMPIDEDAICDKCGNYKIPLTIDCSILNQPVSELLYSL